MHSLRGPGASSFQDACYSKDVLILLFDFLFKVLCLVLFLYATFRDTITINYRCAFVKHRCAVESIRVEYCRMCEVKMGILRNRSGDEDRVRKAVQSFLQVIMLCFRTV